jgi:radial spoke head protein 9
VNDHGFSYVLHLNKEVFNAKDLPKSGLTELDRLSFVIHQIDSQCFLVPVGSFKRTPLGEVHVNEAFSGLSLAAAANLNSYMHFRVCHQADKIAAHERNDDIYVEDFLDNAAKVKHHGGWTVTKDTSCTTGILRSRLWPGFMVFHRANTNVYGNFYMGNGIKNVDIAFMI